MKFNRVTPYAEVSEDGRYTVSGHRVSKDPPKYGYQAWRRPENGSKAVADLLGTKDNVEDARELCRADARARSA